MIAAATIKFTEARIKSNALPLLWESPLSHLLFIQPLTFCGISEITNL